MVYYCSQSMRKRGNWNFEDLEKATEEVKEGKLSVREASQKYSIPKSTVYDHSSSKVKEVSRPGPSPELVNWIITMAGVGLASSPVPLFSRAGRRAARFARRASRGEEKRRAWYPLFAHVQDFHGIP